MDVICINGFINVSEAQKFRGAKVLPLFLVVIDFQHSSFSGDPSSREFESLNLTKRSEDH